jgi:hypothetical protein
MRTDRYDQLWAFSERSVHTLRAGVPSSSSTAVAHEFVASGDRVRSMR